MARLFLQYLAIYNKQNLPNKHKLFAKLGSKFDQILNKPRKKIRKSLKILPNGGWIIA